LRVFNQQLSIHHGFRKDADGYEVVAAQYRLDTPEGDVAAVKRALGQVNRGTPKKWPMRDTSKPANGIRQDKVVITHDRSLRQ
jgi:hypothetical protein